MAAATGRIRRLKRIDRVAVGVITLGGLAVVVSVIGILLFIGAEALPLFRAPTATLDAAGRAGRRTVGHADIAMAALGVDETRRYLFSADASGAVQFFAVDTGARVFERRLPALDWRHGHGLVAVAAAGLRRAGHQRRACRARDRCASRRSTRTAASSTSPSISAERGLVAIDEARRPVRRVAYLEEGERKFVAAQLSDAEVALWWTDEGGRGPRRRSCKPPGGAVVTAMGVGPDRHRVCRHGPGRPLPLGARRDRPCSPIRSAPASAPISALGLRHRQSHAHRGHGARATSAPGSAPRSAENQALKLVRVVGVRAADGRPSRPSPPRRAIGRSSPPTPTAASRCATRRRDARCCHLPGTGVVSHW